MEHFEEKESIVFEIEGQKLFGVLHLPLGQKNVPAVLMCHGLAGNKTGRYRIYVNLAQQLSKAGIASFRVDFRGCGDSDGDFHDTTVKSFLTDAKKSLDILCGHPAIDINRVGLFGRSFGAAIAVMTAGVSNKAKSVSLWAPLFDTKQWQEKWAYCMDEKTPQNIRDQMLYIDGQQGSEKFFKEFFEINLEPSLDKLKEVPLLHIHGIKDDVISITQSEYYENIRKAAKATSKFIRLPEADHNFADHKDQEVAIAETVNWFKATLM